jgi:hypothetical protein
MKSNDTRPLGCSDAFGTHDALVDAATRVTSTGPTDADGHNEFGGAGPRAKATSIGVGRGIRSDSVARPSGKRKMSGSIFACRHSSFNAGSSGSASNDAVTVFP